jgi:Rps23 Pro-64 3,4-dihydroxylase Tpa1-like proline 4-hydroxylase
VIDLLHPKLRQNIDDLARQFADARPFRHVVVDEFLEPSFCARLMESFPRFDTQKAINEMGGVGRKAVISDLPGIGPAYREFDQLMRDRDFLELMGKVAGIPRLVYDPDYVGGGTHENLDGQDLDLHVDFNFHPTRLLHRRLNLIVFLNQVWAESWGGCLELHEDPWNPDARRGRQVVPAANRGVLFETTEASWHGFTRIALPQEQQHLSRRSIAVYFYTTTRPAQETAAPHGTVYIPRPLPEHLQAGYTLRQEDVDMLHILTERRDAQIRFLHKRELQFSRVIQGITSSPAFRLGRALTWPVRKLRGPQERQ